MTAAGAVSVSTTPAFSSELNEPFYAWGGGVGVPGEFTFTQGSPGVVEFEYRVDSETAALVAASAGLARVNYTASSSGFHTMTVRGRGADGPRAGHRSAGSRRQATMCLRSTDLRP